MDAAARTSNAAVCSIGDEQLYFLETQFEVKIGPPPTESCFPGPSRKIAQQLDPVQLL